MKKLLFLSIFAVIAITNVNAQGQFKAGVNLGIPVGDAGDVSKFTASLDLSYLFEISRKFKLGPIIGYQTFFKDKDVVPNDFSFLPIGGTTRYAVSENFTLGADLALAVGIAPSGIKSGVFFAPKVQYGLSENTDIVLSYRNISVDSVILSSIALGVEFGF